ncbi:hypothetical protein V8E55_010229, partial [Tylopilus felleus]
GCIEWLFDDQFCDFSRYQFCFYVTAAYHKGRYCKRIMRTTLDRFSNSEGRSPGYISLSASRMRGGATEYHHVPARFLTPASPSSQDQ